MDRKNKLKSQYQRKCFAELNELYLSLDGAMKNEFDRSLPFSETIFDRWERAKRLHFGDGSSIYDNSLVFGKPTVGKETWIGPFTIIDGSGGLVIGSNCTISSGVHIYSHDNVMQTLSGGNQEIERESVSIGDRVYLGPNSIISKGVKIGSVCVLAANSFLNKDMPDNTIFAGNPAKKKGDIVVQNGKIEFKYI